MAGTWADVLDMMEVLNNELETGSGEDHEGQALLACKMALYQFENIARTLPKVLGTVTNSTTTTANTETTTWPTALLRLDKMQLLDANGKVVRTITRLQEVGSHAPSLPWPLNLVSAGSGAPAGYFVDMANFYWMPLPDAAHSIRLYGLFAATVPSARSTSYPYHDHSKIAMAQFAVFLMKYGVDDAKADLDALGAKLFTPLLKGLRKFDRSGSMDRHYDYVHST